MLVVEAAADQALDAEDGVLGVGDGLPLGGLADQRLVLRIADDGGRGARAFRVLDDAGLAAIHDGDAAVGGPEVDTDDLCHMSVLSWSRRSEAPGSVQAPRAHPFKQCDPGLWMGPDRGWRVYREGVSASQ